ncbi:MAG TPA: SRPBCC family protein [Rubrobacteraceae bacterium]|nr:SRPBCC family protein [Rubrobacteraceae bacterium]
MRPGRAAGVVGLAVGLLVGGRLVKTYDWRTQWTVPAPLHVVYEAMTSRSAVREWWPSMEQVEDGGGEALRVGSTVDFSVHQAPEVARLAPPFRIHCRYTDVEPERRLRQVVTGDLTGVLETLFDEVPSGTRVRFNWYVRVTNPALNLLGYAAERVYRHSHDSVMREGEEGLRRYCAKRAGS